MIPFGRSGHLLSFAVGAALRRLVRPCADWCGVCADWCGPAQTGAALRRLVRRLRRLVRPRADWCGPAQTAVRTGFRNPIGMHSCHSGNVGTGRCCSKRFQNSYRDAFVSCGKLFWGKRVNTSLHSLRRLVRPCADRCGPFRFRRRTFRFPEFQNATPHSNIPQLFNANIMIPPWETDLLFNGKPEDV